MLNAYECVIKSLCRCPSNQVLPIVLNHVSVFTEEKGLGLASLLGLKPFLCLVLPDDSRWMDGLFGQWGKVNPFLKKPEAHQE